MPMSVLQFPQDQEEKIASWMKQVKFRKQIFGGVPEVDVWKKISELNELYHSALIAERARYDALLAEHEKKEGGDGV